MQVQAVAQKPLLGSQFPQMPMVGGPWGHWTDRHSAYSECLFGSLGTHRAQGCRDPGRTGCALAPVHCYLANGQPGAAPGPAEWEPHPPTRNFYLPEEAMSPTGPSILPCCIPRYLPARVAFLGPRRGSADVVPLGQREQQGLRGQTQSPIPTRFLPQHPPCPFS